MQLFPSTPAAAVAGAIGCPLCMYASSVIAQRSESPWLQFAVACIAFVVTALAIVDFRSFRDDWRRGSLFSWRSMARDFSDRRFERVVLPAWKRMAVWFASVVVSTALLQSLGVAL